jgi:hypothetical protein
MNLYVDWEKNLTSIGGYSLTDSQGNLYILNASTIIKYNSSGSIIFSKSYSLGLTNTLFIDYSDNLYIIGSRNAGSSISIDTFSSSNPAPQNSQAGFVVKLRSTDGSAIWAKWISPKGAYTSGQSPYVYMYSLGFDTNNNVYIHGDKSRDVKGFVIDSINVDTYTSRQGTFIAKVNSSGIVQWLNCYSISVDGGSSGMVCDPNGSTVSVVGAYGSNIQSTGQGIVSFPTYQVDGNNYFYTPDTNNLGLYIIRFSGSTGNYSGRSIGDMARYTGFIQMKYSNGSILLALRMQSGLSVSSLFGTSITTSLNTNSSNNSIILSISTSGTVNWYSWVQGPASSSQDDIIKSFVCDSDNNIYIGGESSSLSLYGVNKPLQSTSNSGAFLSKLNSSGTHQSTMWFDGPGTQTMTHITVDKDKNVYLFGGLYSSSSYYNAIKLTPPPPALAGSIAITAGASPVQINSSLSLTASYTGGAGTVSYKWKLGSLYISGATSASYDISNTYLFQNDTTNSYSCEISRAGVSGMGAGTITSNSISVTIKGFGLPVAGPPTATKSAIYSYESTTLTLPTPTGGKPGYTYKWSISGEVDISGATSAFYIVQGHSETTQRIKQYICRVTDAAGSVTTSPAVSITCLVPSEKNYIYYARTLSTEQEDIVKDGINELSNNFIKYTSKEGYFQYLSSVINGVSKNPPIEYSNASVNIPADAFTPPSNIAYTFFETRKTKINVGAPPNSNVASEAIVFKIKKFDANKNLIESSLDNSGTFGTLRFSYEIGKKFAINWEAIQFTAMCLSGNQIIYFPKGSNVRLGPGVPSPMGISLSFTYNATTNRNDFVYFGPNSDITIVPIEDERVIPCFTKGTRILTPEGEKLVENLCTNDLVLTADGRTVAATVYSTHVPKTTAKTAPYCIPAHSFGVAPTRDLIVSAKHAIQSSKGVWQIPEFCSKAKQLPAGEEVTYYHIELPNYFTDNLIANGIVAESLANKQVDRSKTLYTYNKKLAGFTRNSPSTTTKSATKH